MATQKSLIGFEIELFLLDKLGQVKHSSDEILKYARSNPCIKKESSKNMIEIAANPNKNVPKAMMHALYEIEKLIEICEKNNTLLCPLGTYPGNFTPIMGEDKKYKIKQSIFGKNKFAITGRCSGFHCHYTLPSGIFDSQLRILKMLAHQKIKDSLVNGYNMMIAIDPALTCFMQSSPFYQGDFIGKDSRMIMYRGGEHLNNKTGVYTNFQEFGGLPHYMLTTFDLEEILTANFELWKSYIKSLGMNIKVLSMYGSILDTTWAPVKINPNGTLEQRGMDMNHPEYILAVGILIKSILKKLEEERIAVIPSDIGIKEPFKMEKDIVYIPPFSYVRKDLQRLSAYKGMESFDVHEYCKKLLKFTSPLISDELKKLLDPLILMTKERRTVSDDVLELARKKGWRKDIQLGKRTASEIALYHSEKFAKEIAQTKERIAKLI